MERQVQPGQLQRVLDEAHPGDVVLLMPGEHTTEQPVRVPRGGTAEAKLTIRAAAGARIDGRRKPNPDDFADPRDRNHTREPQAGDWCFFSLRNIEHVVFENLDIRNCWPMAIFAQNCRYVTMRGANVEGSTFALFARDDFKSREQSHHFLIEQCTWSQPGTAGHKLWNDYEWKDAHGAEGGNNCLRYFNGGFFGSGDIVGNVVIRDNHFSDAFNGVVFWATEELKLHPAEMVGRNRHIHVYRNTFTRIRDNPVEPEHHVHDLRIRHNTLLNCHAWFSLDSVAGGFWYIYGNTGYFDSKPGGSSNHTGKVLKFYSKAPFPPADPVYVFNNSWRLRCPVTAGDEKITYRTENLDFFGNAIEYCRRDVDGGICEDPAFVEFFDWSTNVRFDRDVSDHARFPKALRDVGREAGGLHAASPIFVDGRNGNFALAAGSPAAGFGTAKTLALADGQSVEIHPRDAGAFQGDTRLSIPELEEDGLMV